jgi:hypothetical protein
MEYQAESEGNLDLEV